MSSGAQRSMRGSVREAPASRAAPVPEGAGGAVEALFAETSRRRERGDRAPASPGELEAFLAAASPLAAIRLWLGGEALRRARSAGEVLRMLAGHIAEIDAMLADQVNAILHHPRFQRLEATWRGLDYLVDGADEAGGKGIKIKVLNATWKELAQDVQRAVEFDQSRLFQKVYSEEFDMPGGEPFGVLLGDYSIRHLPSARHPIDDLDVLTSISQVSAAAFSPFVAAADPALFGVESFSRLERPMNVARIFEEPEYVKWRGFRDSEDARFVGLVLPRVLMRLPYGGESRDQGFHFREDVEGPDNRKYLWGSAVYAFGAVLIRAFADSGWLADIRGVQRGVDGGGLVTGLPVHQFSTDTPGVALKMSAELSVGEQLEKDLADLGFMPLCHSQDTPYSVFYSNQSIQRPKTYNTVEATTNAKISAMLQYILCVSRFAHSLKVRMQHKVGSFEEAHDLENDLNRWIYEYVAPDPHAAPEVKARFPLREASVEIRPRLEGKPGSYVCILRLMPHYQLDFVTASLELKTELREGAA